MPRGKNKPVPGTDEADILTALDAMSTDPDDPNASLVADEEAVRKAGAVDVDSIRANRVADATVNRKLAGEKNVPINEPLLQKYETILRMWALNTLSIFVRRLTGAQAEWTINSQPRNGVELYAAIRALHGRHEEATYDVEIRDSYMKQKRGNGRITMPDTREELPPAPAQSGAQPMNPFYPPQPYPPAAYPSQAPYPPPGYAPAPAATAAPVQPVPPAPAAPPVDPVGMMQQMFQLFQQMQQSAQPQQPGTSPAAAFDPNAQMALVGQMFQLFQQMQQAAHGATPPAAQAVGPAAPSGPMPADPAGQVEWMRQMFEMFRQMQAGAPQPSGWREPRRAPQVDPVTAMAIPPMQPPPGTMWVPGFGFVPTDRLVAAVTGQPMDGRHGGGHRPPYAARSGPYPQGDREYPPADQPPRPHAGVQQARQPTVREQFQEAAGIIRFATDIADEFGGRAAGPQAAAPEVEEDDSPIRVIDTGPAKLVINRQDGSARLWETGWANMDKVLKWVGEQREAIQKSADARAAAQRPQQLPPGYVEVGPGYQPPPGYVAVPVTAQPPAAEPPPPQQALPPPPAQMPPPISQQPPPRTWDLE